MTGAPPRVLALTHVFPRAVTDPSAPFLLTWARALADAGADVGVIAPHDARLPGRHEVAGVPVRLARYAPPRWERIAYRGEMHQLVRRASGPPLIGALLGALARVVRQEVRRGRPDVLHVHWWVPGAIAARLARVDVPTVLTLHGTDVALLEARPRAIALARWALAACDRVETVSVDLADRLERTTGRVADAVNPMPLDPAWLAVPPPPVSFAPVEGPFTVLAAGRMVPEKGFADLVDAVAGMAEPVARLVLVGDGPERERLAARAAHAGVEAVLPGRLSPEALRAAYGSVSLVVQPSHREGLGLVAAEAACAGTPVVATDSGGARDVLGADGLVPVGDVGALRAALASVAADPAAARERSALVAVRVRERLSPAATAARTLDGYRALTAG
ncbi:MAG: glycosyltransferase [Egibacteraceae bacterium]